jgi:c-di-GMP-binding flagellar brake protein YcgR
MDDIEKSFAERRGWPRTIIHKVIDEAQLLLHPPSDEAPPLAEVVNISASGAGVLLPMRIEKGTQVRLQIKGTQFSGLDLEAEVRWSAEEPVSGGKYPVGLKFLLLEEQRQSKLQELIEEMRQHPPTPE